MPHTPTAAAVVGHDLVHLDPSCPWVLGTYHMERKRSIRPPKTVLSSEKSISTRHVASCYLQAGEYAKVAKCWTNHG